MRRERYQTNFYVNLHRKGDLRMVFKVNKNAKERLHHLHYMTYIAQTRLMKLGHAWNI